MKKVDKVLPFVAVLFFLSVAEYAFGQERIVDDAAITTFRSFQIETWYGQYESEFIPAIGWNDWLETSLGFMFASPDGMSLSGVMLEGKVVNTDYEVDGQAIGFVIGTVFDGESDSSEWYAYVPYSRLFLRDTSVLHVNVGLNYSRYTGGATGTGFTYGMRADWGVHDRLDVLTGVFAENEKVSFYGGFRIHAIPGLLELLPTYGQRFIRGHDVPGFALQLSLTPSQLW